MGSYCYSAFGLTFVSALSLPGLEPGNGEADVFVDLQHDDKSVDVEPHPIRCLAASPQGAHLRWGGVGDLFIESCRKITVVASRTSDEDALRLFLLGAGLGVLLHLRGLLVLHASCVRVGDQAVAFLGAKGAGKSTMAAFLRNRRHVLVSDELLVMRLDGEGAPQLSAGPSQIRLWQDALDYLDTDPTHTHRRPVRAGVPKFYCDVPRDDDTQASLRRIYILGSGEGIDLSPVAPSQAFFSVLPHLYVCRFGSTILQGAGPANAFALLGQLVRTVPVLTLARRPALEELPLVAEIIEQDLCNDSF